MQPITIFCQEQSRWLNTARLQIKTVTMEHLEQTNVKSGFQVQLLEEDGGGSTRQSSMETMNARRIFFQEWAN